MPAAPGRFADRLAPAVEMAAGDLMFDAAGNVMLDANGNEMISDGLGDACCCSTTDNLCTCPRSACPNTNPSFECPSCCDQSHAGVVVNRTPSAYHIVITGVQICPDKTFCINCGITNYCVRLNQSTFSGSFIVTPEQQPCLYRFHGDAIDYLTLDKSDGAGGHVPFTDRNLKIAVQYAASTGGPASASLSMTLDLPWCPVSAGGGATIFSFRMTNPPCCSTPNISVSNDNGTTLCANASFGVWGTGGSATAVECAA